MGQLGDRRIHLADLKRPLWAGARGPVFGHDIVERGDRQRPAARRAAPREKGVAQGTH
jgi:hypothetical protein